MADNQFGYRSKAQFAYSTIRSAIVSGALMPGERLVLSHLANDLGISEIPVREAVKQLEAEGLVSKSGIAFMVAKLSKQELEENYVIRSALEVTAARTASEVMDDETLVKLEEVFDRMATCLESGDYVKYGEYNQQFHLLIYAKSPYSTLYQMIRDLWEHAERTRTIFALRTQTSTESHKEHAAILLALKARNSEQVELAMRRHSDRTLSVIKSLLEDSADKK